MVAIATAIAAIYFTWPSGVLLALAAMLFFAARCSSNPWSKALSKIIKPVVCGLGLVVLTTLLVNFLALSPKSLERLEGVIVWTAAVVPHWLKLSNGKAVITYFVLVVIGFALPKLRLISRFKHAQRYTTLAASTLATFGTFSFFAPLAVSRHADELHKFVVMSYRTSKDRQAQSIAKTLVYRKFGVELPKLPPGPKLYLAAIVRATQDWSSRDIQSPLSAKDLGLADATEPRPDAVDVSKENEQVSMEDLRQQLWREKKSDRKLSDTEEEIKEIMSKTLELGTDRLKDIAWGIFQPLLDDISGEISAQIRKYLNKVADEYIRKMTEPKIEEWSGTINRRIQRLWNARRKLDSRGLQEDVRFTLMYAYMARARRYFDESNGSIGASDQDRKAALDALKAAVKIENTLPQWERDRLQTSSSFNRKSSSDWETPTELSSRIAQSEAKRAARDKLMFRFQTEKFHEYEIRRQTESVEAGRR